MNLRKPDEPRRWLDEPRNVDKIFWALCVLCAVVGLAELPLHKHGHFPWEDWFDFHGLYAFLGCVFLVLVAKQLRRILMRDEDYYDR